MSQEHMNAVRDFILDPARREFTFHTGDAATFMLKVAYNDNIDFLYTQYQYKPSQPLQLGEKLEYAGFVHHPTGRIFDCGYYIRGFTDRFSSIPVDSLIEEAEAAVADAIFEIVAGRPVPITEDSEPIGARDREYYLEHLVNYEARRAFYDGVEQIEYHPQPPVEQNTKNVMHMVEDMEGFVEMRAYNFVRTQAAYINQRLWEISVAQEKLEELRRMPGLHHTTLAIANSVSSNMKTVTVFLRKEETEITVKMSTPALRNAETRYYSTYNMDAPGRREFEKTFGRSAELLPQDILRITYGKKVLYERKNA